ncbi:peptidoglycan-binding domain-containing protein [uncultured Polaribacter sp.]|uniref:peptidoglycan-binding domain-containing protein n=1 Tax=uncultured Polaribacter sp. TaxID=174711 RepID=UPI002606358F|nr:peptidoglycan-binding domain-containing protein [uncultured Polaribacter sp.]
MKQLIILLLLIIAFFIGFGKYQEYKRYNSEGVAYQTSSNIDKNYYNQEIVLQYFNATEALNGLVKTAWSANNIDVRSPENNNEETKKLVANYAKKLALVKYYEAKLEDSKKLKEKGLSNKQIQFLEEKGIDIESFNRTTKHDKIKSMFNANERLVYGKKSALIYEVQKRLIENGFQIKKDGIYKLETLNAIKNFEEKNQLFPDGILDILTLDALFK